MSAPYSSKPPANIAEDVELVESLRFFVPLWIAELWDCTPEQRAARAIRCATSVGTKGDMLLFTPQGPSARRNAVEAINALAEGLACAAYLPGGVDVAGLHWCVPGGRLCGHRGSGGSSE